MRMQEKSAAPARVRWSLIAQGLVLQAFVLTGSSPVWAQRDTSIPRSDYLLAREAFNEGDYASALRGFSQMSVVKVGTDRWIDSACQFAMAGECLYQLGDTPQALQRFEDAIQMFLVHRNWMMRIEFPQQITPEARATRPITWGTSGRRTTVGRFPGTMLSFQGTATGVTQLNANEFTVSLPEAYAVRVTEICRAIALAIRRRTEILGPVAEESGLTGTLVDALSGPGIAPDHPFAQAWLSTWMGLALAAEGKPAQAQAELEKSLSVGQVDHPLTSCALVELGKLAYQAGNFPAAQQYLLEASYSAAAMEQYDVLEEALRWGTLTHMARGERELYPPLPPAAVWAHNESKHVEVSVYVDAAENYTHLGQTQEAVAALGQARKAMSRSEIGRSRIGARAAFQTATASLDTGDLKVAQKFYNDALAFQRKGSVWGTRIALVDTAYTKGQMSSDRVAIELYDRLLREPTPADWFSDPLDTLAYLSTPHQLSMEHWFQAALDRKEAEKALEITDLIKRHRFHSALPFGGRSLALRWLMEAPPEALGQTAMLQRQDLLAKHGGYAPLAQRVTAIQTELGTLPLVPEDKSASDRQAVLLKELAEVSGQQEQILNRMLLRRDPTEYVFPPRLNVKALQPQLAENQAVLSYFVSSRAVHAFMISRAKYGHWELKSPSKVKQETIKMLRQMGNYEDKVAIGTNELDDTAWRTTGHSLLLQLTNNADADVWDRLDELILIPDGILWYVPFEALTTSAGADGEPLLNKTRLRYVPTASLALPDRRRLGPEARTAVAAGKLSLKGEDAVAEEGIERVRAALPGSMKLPNKLPVPASVYVTMCDRLIALHDIADQGSDAYGWSPIESERGKPSNNLASWFTLPWGGPQQVILPGFHTPAENSLKKAGTGEDLFLAACGLMANGARTILISRWNVGGRSSYELVREFAQELPHSSAAASWQRSVQLLRAADLDTAAEPRLKEALHGKDLKGEHPFFWSGYLLIDTGVSPATE